MDALSFSRHVGWQTLQQLYSKHTTLPRRSCVGLWSLAPLLERQKPHNMAGTIPKQIMQKEFSMDAFAYMWKHATMQKCIHRWTSWFRSKFTSEARQRAIALATKYLTDIPNIAIHTRSHTNVYANMQYKKWWLNQDIYSPCFAI